MQKNKSDCMEDSTFATSTYQQPESLVMLLSQHRVSSSKTVRPSVPCGARCMGHAVSTWSTVCSEAPHSQFGEEARPHLCIDE